MVQTSSRNAPEVGFYGLVSDATNAVFYEESGLGFSGLKFGAQGFHCLGFVCLLASLSVKLFTKPTLAALESLFASYHLLGSQT
mmetsp:Transcript_27091/g.42374  ORF Transcript_27091/g.42374 Transcript_27091/m.42374 type:complete len:84 (-) Transcript_27091:320-571(-)